MRCNSIDNIKSFSIALGRQGHKGGVRDQKEVPVVSKCIYVISAKVFIYGHKRGNIFALYLINQKHSSNRKILLSLSCHDRPSKNMFY